MMAVVAVVPTVESRIISQILGPTRDTFLGLAKFLSVQAIHHKNQETIMCLRLSSRESDGGIGVLFHLFL